MERIEKRIVQGECGVVNIEELSDSVIVIRQGGYEGVNRVIVESARLEALIIALLEVRAELNKR